MFRQDDSQSLYCKGDQVGIHLMSSPRSVYLSSRILDCFIFSEKSPRRILVLTQGYDSKGAEQG